MGGFCLSLRLGSHKVAANEEDERGDHTSSLARYIFSENSHVLPQLKETFELCLMIGAPKKYVNLVKQYPGWPGRTVKQEQEQISLKSQP